MSFSFLRQAQDTAFRQAQDIAFRLAQDLLALFSIAKIAFKDASITSAQISLGIAGITFRAKASLHTYTIPAPIDPIK